MEFTTTETGPATAQTKPMDDGGLTITRSSEELPTIVSTVSDSGPNAFTDTDSTSPGQFLWECFRTVAEYAAKYSVSYSSAIADLLDYGTTATFPTMSSTDGSTGCSPEEAEPCVQ